VTHLINPRISIREKQIIIGTILGGSSIVKPAKGKNCYLSMRSKNGLWLDFKARELSNFASAAPITIEKTNRWHSLCYPIFNDLRTSFYDKDGARRVKKEMVESLHDTALAVWFGDCGKYIDGEIILNTHIWKEKGSKVIKKCLGYCGWKAEIFMDRKSFRVKLDETSSKDFLSYVVPHLPPFINPLATPEDIPNQDQ
jgi:hypothetical protein